MLFIGSKKGRYLQVDKAVLYFATDISKRIAYHMPSEAVEVGRNCQDPWNRWNTIQSNECNQLVCWGLSLRCQTLFCPKVPSDIKQW